MGLFKRARVRSGARRRIWLAAGACGLIALVTVSAGQALASPSAPVRATARAAADAPRDPSVVRAAASGGSANPLLVTNVVSGTVSAIGPTWDTTVGVGKDPWGVAFTPGGQSAYVVNGGSGTVSVITNADTAGAAVSQTLTLGNASNNVSGAAIAITPDGQYAYVTDSNSDTVTVIDGVDTTHPVVSSTVLTVGLEPDAIAITPDGQYAYVLGTLGTVTVIDGASTADPTVGPTLTIGGNQLSSITITPDGQYAYVTNSSNSNYTGYNVAVIGGIATGDPAVAATLTVGDFPYDVAFSANGQYAYVIDAEAINSINPNTGAITVVDGASSTDPTVGQTITDIGGGEGGGYSIVTSPDGQYAYLANIGLMSVSPITGIRTGSPVESAASWPTGTLPGQIAVAPSSAAVCTPASPTECLLASNAVSTLDTSSDIEPPAGMTLEDQQVIPRDGFAAAEFADSQGNIIIANEGAHYASPFGRATTYEDASLVAQTAILAGKSPAALNDAVAFAQYVKAHASSGVPIYVTGFDLGGVEAEAQAQALQSGVTGGLTFGASGLPGYAMSGSGSSLVNIVDYGDGIGNWSSDPGGELASLAPASTNHYGAVDLVGNPLSAGVPFFAADTHKISISNLINQIFGTKWGPGDAFSKLLRLAPVPQAKAVKAYDAVMKTASYAFLGGSALLFHSIAQYAQDLSVSLTPTVAPPTSMADYVEDFDPSASQASLRTANATTVTASGTLTAPTYRMTGNTATDALTSESYTSADSQYIVAYDPAQQISSLKVNAPGGTSYQIFNDDMNQNTWATMVNFYSATNEAGTLTGTLYNWHTGGSQLQLFVGLPRHDTEETINYSGADATGTVLSKSYK
jgi:YVTN family beta-propeller protein